MTTQQTWTVMSILNWSSTYLADKGIDNARTVVEWLLCDTLACSRMDLYLKFDRSMTEAELGKFRPMLLKCAAKQPVQQVVGNCEFYGLKLAVNEHVLVPRPETERLVDEAIRLAPALLDDIDPAVIKRNGSVDGDGPDHEIEHELPRELNVLDIGSGSGCIAIALAMRIPQARVTAVETSPDAVDVLKRNINFYNLANRITVLQADIRQFKPALPFHLIVSNPPYIGSHEMGSLDENVSYYEPHLALSDKDDGLTFYRFFASVFGNWMAPNAVALLEYGGNPQTEAIREIFASFDQRIVKDYQQDDRVIILRSKGATV